MLKHLADLSDDHEYFLVFTGQSNLRSRGLRTDAYQVVPDLEMQSNGVELTGLTIGSTPSVGDIVTYNVGTTLTVNQWCGAKLRMGTSASPLVGYAEVRSNTDSTVTLKWIVVPTVTGSQSATVTREDYQWASYPDVRVLVPYQPTTDSSTDTDILYPSSTSTIANGGRALRIPGYTTPSGLTTLQHAAVLLPFSFGEGIEGYGLSEINDGSAGANPATGATSSDFTQTSTMTANLFVGGKLRVDWHDGTVARVSWSTIGDNDASKFTGLSWEGDGTPTGTASTWRWTAWIPHFLDSPYSYLPGEGWNYPANDMMPKPRLKCRPRNRTSYGYQSATFSLALVVAARMSAATGKRINVIHLGIDAASLVSPNGQISYGHQGKIGWWDHQKSGTFNPSLTTSLFQRVVDLLQYGIPNALAAEGSTKTAKVIGLVHVQGETEAGLEMGRRYYASAIKAFFSTLRKRIASLGLNPYANGAQIPFVQPRIATVLYELNGSFTTPVAVTLYGDSEGLVNNAIEEHAGTDGFGATVPVNDLPRVYLDFGHYNGVGEAVLGQRIADRLTWLANYALSFGSTAVSSTPAIVDLCNDALMAIGESRTITSLDQATPAAQACRRLIQRCVSTLLQQVQWPFARRRQVLTKVRMPERSMYRHFAYCYLLPLDALTAFAVLPPATTESTLDPMVVLSSSYSAQFVEDYLPPSTADYEEDNDRLVQRELLKSVPYAIEQSPYGHRYIYSDQHQAVLEYTALVMDASLYPPTFKDALVSLLAAQLATALIKGDAGEAVAARSMQKAGSMLKLAAAQQLKQQHIPESNPLNQLPPHLSNR